MKLIFASSSPIALKTLSILLDDPGFEIIALITQPDKPQGRGLLVQPNAVAAWAADHHLTVYKPTKIIELQAILEKLDYDIFLTFAYGQIIPESILKTPRLLALNIHGSLLPEYRGAAPIQYTILNKSKYLGITLIEMVRQMDAGDMFFQAKAPLSPNYTLADAFMIVSQLAADQIVKWLTMIEQGNYTRTPQGKDYSLAPKITSEFARLTPETMTKSDCKAKIKALSPFPGAYLFDSHGKRLKVFDVSDYPVKGAIVLTCLDGLLYGFDFQAESKKRVKLSTI